VTLDAAPPSDDRARLAALEEQLGDVVRALGRALRHAGPRRGQLLAMAAQVQAVQREVLREVELAEAAVAV
jgi:hypothetical protein